MKHARLADNLLLIVAFACIAAFLTYSVCLLSQVPEKGDAPKNEYIYPLPQEEQPL